MDGHKSSNDLVICKYQTGGDSELGYSNFRKYAHPLHVKEGIITEKVPQYFLSVFLDLFWLSHVHLGVNGCHRKVCISNVKK